MEVRNRFSDRVPVVLEFPDQGMTQQSFKAECDINTIMARYQKTGLLEHVSRYQGRYEDVAESMDYQSALNVVMAAEEAFASLPSSIRARFENDPGQFLAFVEDPGNEDEMVDLGLKRRLNEPEASQEEPHTQDDPEPVDEPEAP